MSNRWSRQSDCAGAAHSFWSDGYSATGPPFGEVDPTVVLETAIDGKQDVGSRLRPMAPDLFRSASDDLLAGAFTTPDPIGSPRFR